MTAGSVVPVDTKSLAAFFMPGDSSALSLTIGFHQVIYPLVEACGR